MAGRDALGLCVSGVEEEHGMIWMVYGDTTENGT
jgi:hypothetical protein